MIRSTFCAAALLLAAVLVLSPVRAATELMPIGEINPGMIGIGHTVFDGTRVEEFRVRILGVIENVMAPQRNLILARLEGGPLAETGVIAGMSGSPVYVDGRLIGAVAYALGSFSKEPIAGITPIEEMTDATALGGPRPAAARVDVQFPLTQDTLIAAFRKALNWNRPFASRAADVQLVGVDSIPGLGGREIGPMLRPIATPLVMAGFEPELQATLGAAFQDQGFVPSGGGAAATRPGEMPFDGPLKPGDAVGVNFVSGDLLLGGTGTVTHIDGDRVYAFGHPMYNLGPTEFPMTRAYVYTVLPSLFSSTKLSTTGEVIGTILQDRATAIAGRLGAGPTLIPVTISLETERGAARTFKFDVVRDQLFTPLMTFSALANTLISYERQFGTATYEVEGRLAIGGHDPITFANLFTGEGASNGAASYVIAPLTALMNNELEKVDVESLDLTFRSAEEPRTATIERAWIDDPRPRAGRTVPLKVLLRTYRGAYLLRTIPIDSPANARGTPTVMATAGRRPTPAETRETRTTQWRTVPQLVRTLNRTRRNDTLYVRLLSSEPGAVVNGEPLPALPPSVMAVLEADRSTGSFSPLGTATLGEWELPTAHVISGVRTLTIPVSAN